MSLFRYFDRIPKATAAIDVNLWRNRLFLFLMHRTYFFRYLWTRSLFARVISNKYNMLTFCHRELPFPRFIVKWFLSRYHWDEYNMELMKRTGKINVINSLYRLINYILNIITRRNSSEKINLLHWIKVWINRSEHEAI